MKKTLEKFLGILLIGIPLFCLCSCNDDGPDPDVIWDFAPIEFVITVTGENGEDLLNPSTPGTYALLSATAHYEGTSYVKDDYGEAIPYRSRAILAYMYGLYSSQTNDGRYALIMGQFDGADTYENDTILLEWGDGSRDVITFSSNLKWKNHKPRFNRSFKLNGEVVAENVVRPVIDIKRKALKQEGTMIYDIAPLVFNVLVMDSLGHDLLNPLVEGHFDTSKVKAVFQEREYYLNDPAYENGVSSRAYLPIFYGLKREWRNANKTHPYPMTFGELDGAETFEDEPLIIDWGNESRDTITFTSKILWENNQPTFIRQYLLNGEEVDKDTSCPVIYIRK